MKGGSSYETTLLTIRQYVPEIMNLNPSFQKSLSSWSIRYELGSEGEIIERDSYIEHYFSPLALDEENDPIEMVLIED